MDELDENKRFRLRLSRLCQERLKELIPVKEKYRSLEAVNSGYRVKTDWIHSTIQLNNRILEAINNGKTNGTNS